MVLLVVVDGCPVLLEQVGTHGVVKERGCRVGERCPQLYLLSRSRLCCFDANRLKIVVVCFSKDVHFSKGFSTPGRTRTCNIHLRRVMLYPVELREHSEGSQNNSRN